MKSIIGLILLLFRLNLEAAAQDILFGESFTDHHDTSTITASKVTFSLHDIDQTSTLVPSEVPSLHHSFISGSLVVPCLIFAIMVVCAFMLQALVFDYENEKLHQGEDKAIIRPRRFDLPIRIPILRRRVYVLETIAEQPPNDDEDLESTNHEVVRWEGDHQSREHKRTNTRMHRTRAGNAFAKLSSLRRPTDLSNRSSRTA